MTKISIYYSKEFMKFSGKFPDTPERLAAIMDYIRTSDLEYTVAKPKPASRKDLERVHSAKYLDEIKNYKRINTYFPDEPVDKNTYRIASLAAGAACCAAEYAISKKRFAFAVTRPKGGHAGRDFFGGYSYINNVAVAIAKLLAAGKSRNPLIINLDAHFCNGTNNIFVDDERVWLLSVHQHADSVYPYTGKEKESTSRVRCYENRLWITDKEYLDKLYKVIPKVVDEVKPDIIAVGIGFNTYYKDLFFGTVTKIKEPRTYMKIGRLLDACAKELDVPIFGVLEGGYWVEDLGELAYNFLKGFCKRNEKLPDVSVEGYR
ncbi:MAG: histone deacetylase family protein [Candidatus Micrarchaeia archaeon]